MADSTATRVRSDFPMLADSAVSYLDSAASMHKSRAVIDAVSNFYAHHYANVHRAVYRQAEAATAIYEQTRQIVADFIGVVDPLEILITHGTTESINLVAQGWAASRLQSTDAIVVSELEHHANLVPWYQVAKLAGCEVRFLHSTDRGELDLADAASKLAGAKVLAISQASNVLGTVLPVHQLAGMAHQAGAVVVVDGAQAAAHLPVSVPQLGADFYAFSGHKIGGPTGIGVLWAPAGRLAEMQPLLTGGEMIKQVGFNEVTFADPPWRFEAGTMPLAEAAGLQAAITYLSKLGMDWVAQHDAELTGYALQALSELDGLRLFGPSQRIGIITFTLDGVHPHDLAAMLDQHHVQVRSGHHCAQPLHQRLGVEATVRASFAPYTTTTDIDRLVTALGSVRRSR